MQIHIDIPRHLAYPSLAAIPFKKGTMTQQDDVFKWQLLEDGIPVHSYVEIVALWPDESVQWIHVNAIFKDKHYSFENVTLFSGRIEPVPKDRDLNWEVQVVDGNG